MATHLATRVTTVIAAAGLAAAMSLLMQRPAAAGSQAPPDAALVARARAIHDRVITLDTHVDINPSQFQPGCNYTMRLTTQANLPKMQDGGLDAAFLIVYVGQGPLTPEGYDGAYRQAVAKFDAVRALTSTMAPDQIGLALRAADVARIAASGRKVAVIGIENGYPIGTNLARVKEFFDRGGRYMSLAHNGHSQLSDSNTGEANNDWMWGGLSPLGRQVIAEMNKWGVMVDVSHPSKASMLQATALSKAPVIASHSSVRALADHSRNMDDEMLMALKASGGVVQIVAFSAYVKADPPGVAAAREGALARLRERFGLATGAAGRGTGGGGGAAGGRGGVAPCPVEDPANAPAGRGARGGGRGGVSLEGLTPEQRAQYELALARIGAEHPSAPRANVRDLVDHIDYAVKRIGIDHVGISSDFDGGGGVDGWNSASETFNVTLELVRRGYTEEQIAKLWSGNLLRVWSEVEQVAAGIQKGQ